MLFLRLTGESFGFAVAALKENRTRTLLSLIGITIGIITIIGVFSAVDTLRSNLEGSVEKLGSKAIYVSKWPWDDGPDFPWWKYMNRPEPTIRDFERLQQRMTTADGICYNIQLEDRTIKQGNKSVEKAMVMASTYDFHKIRNLEFTDGRYFTPGEMDRGVASAIIGSTIAEGLFPGMNPIGRNILVMGRRLNVIGVLKKEGEGMLIDVSLDKIALIPLNLARNMVNIESYSPNIIVDAVDQLKVAETESELRGVMRSLHRLSPHKEDDFSLNKTTIITAQLDQLFSIINVAGAFIGGFSILVGGFGIANIMFVSVKERTHIIGIQKSLGAKNYFILLQFLFESVMLCLIGGLIGLLIVFILAFIVKHVAGIAIVVDISMVIATFLLSSFIGLIAGIIPAIMAARLDPVEAIRAK
ncbi:putative ABC transport system permease protein [bacterium A37T11]|nr:putative ABC transport system permease protein [bacterium A37T11]